MMCVFILIVVGVAIPVWVILETRRTCPKCEMCGGTDSRMYIDNRVGSIYCPECSHKILETDLD